MTLSRHRYTADKNLERRQAMKAGLTIGEMAKELRLNPKTVRYYEEVGLLPKPRRSESTDYNWSREQSSSAYPLLKSKSLWNTPLTGVVVLWNIDCSHWLKQSLAKSIRR
jgi:hypothetical protein